MRIRSCVSALALICCISTAFASEIETHSVETEYQNGKQEIRVLLPDKYRKDVSYRVLYVLPVETGFQNGFGYGLEVLKKMDAHNRHNLIIVQMGFEKEPWFGDHATNPNVRQASYLKDFVVPYIEDKYATMRAPEGRLLFGFSKSGWGAFSLVLKFPEVFGYAAAWDAPITFTTFRYGMQSVYGTSDQLALYRPDRLIPKHAKAFEMKTRLVLTGHSLWGTETVQAHELLKKEGIKHYYDNTLKFPHRWDKDWMEPTLSALIALTEQDNAKKREQSPAGDRLKEPPEE
jgi:enterochelin esterase-like enzyme